MGNAMLLPQAEFAPPRWRRDVGLAVALAVIAGLVAAFHARSELRSSAYPLDLDGWGHLVTRLKNSGHQWEALFREPSLWKGPVVPFLFGLSYYVAPFDESVLVFNGFAFALAAAILFLGFCYLGAGRSVAALAVLFWLLYLPHKIVFAYYMAEPVVSLLSAVLFVLVGATVARKSSGLALVSGGVAGLLLLSRAPFLLVVCGIVPLLWWHLGKVRCKAVAIFALGLLFVCSPWAVRNYFVCGDFIPFTTEGGKILFQGTYLPGDDVPMDQLRRDAGFCALEAAEPAGAVEKYRYWQKLAVGQVKANPVGQIRLIARKLIRFWVYLDGGSWRFNWKTTTVAAVLLPLAALGAIRGRRQTVVQLCALWVCGLWLFHALVHTELRYNFPVLPMVALLACTGVRPSRAAPLELTDGC